MTEQRLITKEQLYDFMINSYPEDLDSEISDKFFNSLLIENEWIPYPENKPEKDGWYLITHTLPSNNKHVCSALFVVDVGWIMIDEQVIAYMPLLEPYKGKK